MKYKMFLLQTIFCFLSLLALNLYAQDKKLVVVSPTVGEEIDRQEREQYHLFKGIENFVSARFYQLPDGTYQIQVRYYDNDKPEEQFWTVSRQEFLQNYQNYIESQKTIIESKIVEIPAKLIQFILKDGREFIGTLDTLYSDSVQIIEWSSTEDAADQQKRVLAYSGMENISVLRKVKIAKAFIIGMIPAGVGAMMGLIIGDDPPGWFSTTAEEKAGLGFIVGGGIGLSISLTLETLRGVDYDISLASKTIQEKSVIFNKISENRLSHQLSWRISPWAGVYYLRNQPGGNYAFLPGLRMRLYFTPRSGLEVSYGGTTWFYKKYKGSSSYYDDQTGQWEFIDQYYDQSLQYFSAGYFISFSRLKKINPFVTWGWGFVENEIKGIYEPEDSIFSVNFDLGLEHHISHWISAESRLSTVLNSDEGIEFLLQAGFHFGKYF